MGTKFVTSKSGLTDDEKETVVDAVVCMLVSDLPVSHVPSRKDVCKGCGEDVWVSLNAPVKPPKYCMPCTLIQIESEAATKQ